MFDEIKKIAAHEDFAAAESDRENAYVREFLQQILYLCGGHLAVIVVVQVTVDAAFVAAVGHVQMDVDGNAQFHCFIVHLLHQTHRGVPTGTGFSMGASETSRMPC